MGRQEQSLVLQGEHYPEKPLPQAKRGDKDCATMSSLRKCSLVTLEKEFTEASDANSLCFTATSACHNK